MRPGSPPSCGPRATAPWGITTTLSASTWYWVTSRVRAAVVIVTTAADALIAVSRTLPLVRCRAGQHGVRDEHHRHPYLIEDREHLVAVLAAVDAVLVLDDREVEGVEQLRRRLVGRGRSTLQKADHLGCLRRDRRVHYPDHPSAHAGTGSGQAPQQRGRKGGLSALRWGIGAEEAIGSWHTGHLPVGVSRTSTDMAESGRESAMTWASVRRVGRINPQHGGVVNRGRGATPALAWGATPV